MPFRIKYRVSKIYFFLTRKFDIFIESVVRCQHPMHYMLSFCPVKSAPSIFPGYASPGLLEEFMLPPWLGQLFLTLDGDSSMAQHTRYKTFNFCLNFQSELYGPC